MDNKLSKPVATVDVQRGRMDGNTFAVAWSSAGHALPDGPHFIYSQEYVSALLAELEAKDKCIAEAEVRGVEKLAAAFKSWASDETFPDCEAQRHWATASQEALSFAGVLRNGSCDDR
ncbi:hypothetical protein ABH11_00602 [Serratia marcescens]|uniref:hypothetical protein n=1 Tax=Serratia marcescens TaxID=615 RepID=UPI0006CB60FD|nr:hypothetical protein [Serratia marcescens]ALE94964.1 hypothetical protein ABH11_00602 [Serratia marcescens]ELD1858188.1 hypothetical protein [Serratia marcescens]HBC5198767.1 hypothetical protein [Serratia marcescens]